MSREGSRAACRRLPTPAGRRRSLRPNVPLGVAGPDSALRVARRERFFPPHDSIRRRALALPAAPITVDFQWAADTAVAVVRAHWATVHPTIGAPPNDHHLD